MVVREDNEIELTYTEFEILLLLAQNIGRVFSKEQIYNRVWKEGQHLNPKKTQGGSTK